MPVLASSVLVSSLSILGLNTAVLHPALTMTPCSQLAPNIHAGAQLRRTIEQLLERSPTLRSQCGRIAAARVLVRVEVSSTAADALTRARSVARRYASGLVVVDVELPPASGDFAELLAHEFEHVVEIVDGVDFKAAADQGDGEAMWRRADGAYESERAKAAGLAAAAEARPAEAPLALALGRGTAAAARAAWRSVLALF